VRGAPEAAGEKSRAVGLSAPDPGGEPETESLNLQHLERMAIWRALKQTGGHRLRAAQLLGISDRTLRNKLRAG
jgi:DNA-binding NtrC family response regulator